MKSSPMRIITAFVAFVSLAAPVVAQEPCCFCGNCWSFPGKENVFVNQQGDTCNDAILNAAEKFTASSSQCRQQSAMHYDRCCTNKAVSSIVQNPPSDPCANVPSASKGPPCDLCHDGAYPKKPSTVTAILGVQGNPSCATLYCMSKKGHITDQLCNPLQDYMDEPCGCYSRFPGNSGQNPTTNSGGDPGNVPTKRDVPDSDGKDNVERLSDQDRKRGSIWNRKLKGASE